MEKLKRYFVFLIGLFINSLGVSLITKADLGTSPISSIPYVLSLNFPFTLGQFTIVFSLLLIVIQLIILRRNFFVNAYIHNLRYNAKCCIVLVDFLHSAFQGNREFLDYRRIHKLAFYSMKTGFFYFIRRIMSGYDSHIICSHKFFFICNPYGKCVPDQTCTHLPSSEALVQTALQRRTISAPSRNDGQAGRESSASSS